MRSFFRSIAIVLGIASIGFPVAVFALARFHFAAPLNAHDLKVIGGGLAFAIALYIATADWAALRSSMNEPDQPSQQAPPDAQ